ncbi:MAG: nicotinamide riboside transporter PnuC [Halioglobus sp.]
MSESLLDNIGNTIAVMSPLEAAAVILGIAYLLLAMRESLWCWPAALMSTSAFLIVFWQVNLLMETALQFYYIAMAVYGWWHWHHGGPKESTLPIRRWRLSQHGMALLAVLALTLISGTLLSNKTDAALPYLDSFTTWGSILTTWMVTQKVLENWLYWLVIDAASLILYLDRELYLTAGLFLVYLIIVIFGFIAWRKHYLNQPNKGWH